MLYMGKIVLVSFSVLFLAGCVPLSQKEDIRSEYEKINFERERIGLPAVDIPAYLKKQGTQAKSPGIERKEMMINRRSMELKGYI